mgnify:CR=1 FL=1
MKRVCNKIGTMQESTYWYWQGGTIQAQLWYHDILQNMDIMFCHNDIDLKYYKGITDVKCELLSESNLRSPLCLVPGLPGL